VLAFLLVNIEIADYFSERGSTLTFQFSGSFARDMTYSIAWALFALVLLVIGISKRARAPRYAGLGLLGVTILKLFFHDLARLDQHRMRVVAWRDLMLAVRLSAVLCGVKRHNLRPGS
jgi:uncharacterized membrane protein